MAEQSNAAVKTMYGIWLKEHLEHYRFVSEQAQELRDRIRELAVATPADEEKLKEYYIRFCSMTMKNPFINLLGMASEKDFHIVTYDSEYFLVRNPYGVYVPVKFLKDNNLPVTYTFQEEKSQAQAKVEQLRGWYSGTVRQTMPEAEKLFKNPDNASTVRACIIFALAAASGYFCYAGFELFRAPDWKSLLLLLSALATVGSLVILGKGILECRNAVRLNKAKRDWKACLTAGDGVASLPRKIDEYDKQLKSRLANTDQASAGPPEMTGAPAEPVRETFVDDFEKMHKGVKELLSKPKKAKRHIGFVSIVLMAVACAFFGILQYGGLAEKMDSVKVDKVFEQITHRGSRDNNKDTASAASETKIHQARVVAPEAKMVSVPGEEKGVVAEYKTGDILEYSQEATNAGGFIWYKLTDSKGTSGWVVQTSVKLIDEKEIAVVAQSASSTLKSSKGAVYKAELANDGYYATCWQEGKKGDGIGEYISFTFDKEEPVSRLVIINGNAKSEESYFKNNPLKTISLVYGDGQKTEIQLEDVYSATGQTILLPAPILTKTVYFYIKEVYSGSAYDDTCLSEAAFYR